MNIELTKIGTFKDSQQEEVFLEHTWSGVKNYTFLTYICCCFFMLLAGMIADSTRHFFYGSYGLLLTLRIGLFASCATFIIVSKMTKEQSRPSNLEPCLDFFKYFSTIIIVLLTIWTKGSSVTLLPGAMMMIVSFFMILPGRIISTLICSIILSMTFYLFQDPAIILGKQMHLYMTFLLVVISLLLTIFKVKMESWARIQYYTTNKTKEISESKDRILEILAHDLNSPINSINKNATLALRELEKGNLENIKSSQHDIKKSVRSLNNIFVDLIFWSTNNLKSGGLLKKDECISNAVNAATYFVKDDFLNKNQTLLLDIEDISFSHDSELLSNCIRNLLINSNTLSPQNASIYLSAKSYDNLNISIRVSDQSGLNNNAISDLLSDQRPSTETHKTSKLRSLDLVKDVVKKHNGIFSIDSDEKEVTIFELLIPIS